MNWSGRSVEILDLQNLVIPKVIGHAISETFPNNKENETKKATTSDTHRT